VARFDLRSFATSKETVSRTLTEFKTDRLIELNGDLATMKSFDLIKIVDADHEQE